MQTFSMRTLSRWVTAFLLVIALLAPTLAQAATVVYLFRLVDDGGSPVAGANFSQVSAKSIAVGSIGSASGATLTPFDLGNGYYTISYDAETNGEIVVVYTASKSGATITGANSSIGVVLTRDSSRIISGISSTGTVTFSNTNIATVGNLAPPSNWNLMTVDGTGKVTFANTSIGSVTGSVGSVTGAVGSVTGSVGSVTGAVGSVTSPVTVTGTPSVNVSQIGGQSVSVAGTVTFPAVISSLTAPQVRTEMDANSTKLDVATSTRLATGGYTAPPTAVQNRQEMDSNSTRLAAIQTKTDFLPSFTAGTTNGVALTSSVGGGGGASASDVADAVWNRSTSLISTTGSIGKRLVDNVNAPISGIPAAIGATNVIQIDAQHTSNGVAMTLTKLQYDHLTAALAAGDATPDPPVANTTKTVLYYVVGQAKISANLMATATVVFNAQGQQTSRKIVVQNPLPTIPNP